MTVAFATQTVWVAQLGSSADESVRIMSELINAALVEVEEIEEGAGS